MTKRFGNFEEINSKKAKSVNNVDDLWGDDLDDDALDDCIRIATQVEEKISCSQDFSFTKPLFSSTQLGNCFSIPSSSKNNLNGYVSNSNNNTEITRLKNQFDEKLGEVSILRSQLQEIKSKNQLEQQKKSEEWNEKLNTSHKELVQLKTELEFKNLEISNLKQKIGNIAKIRNADITLNQSQFLTPQKNKNNIKYPETPCSKLTAFSKQKFKQEAIANTIFPLKNALPKSIFNEEHQENYIIDTKYTKQCRNTIPYLQNQITFSKTNSIVNIKPKCLIINEKNLNLDFIYPEVSALISSTVDEINLERNYAKINKILYVSVQLLNELYNYLTNLQQILRAEDIQQADLDYFDISANEYNFDKESLFDGDKLGIKAGHSILLIAELLPHSIYLRKHLLNGNKLEFNNDEEYVKYFPKTLIKKKRHANDSYYSNLLLNIVNIIGNIRKSSVMSGFLCSVVIYLNNLCKTKFVDIRWCDVLNLTKSIIYSRPKAKVIYNLSYLLKTASYNLVFVENLFQKGSSPIRTKSNKGVIYFSEGSCCFYIFVMLFVNTIFETGNDNFPLNVCLNIMSFIYNTFKWSFDIHHKNINQCECLSQLYKLEIEVVFKALEVYNNYVKNNQIISGEWKNFFNHKCTIKILSLMTFNSYELTEKYVPVYSQYKEIQSKLKESNLDDLEKLTLVEDIPEIASNNKAFSFL